MQTFAKISFLRGEVLLNLPFGGLGLSRVLLSYEATNLSDVTDEPVYLWKIPNRCFVAPVPTNIQVYKYTKALFGNLSCHHNIHLSCCIIIFWVSPKTLVILKPIRRNCFCAVQPHHRFLLAASHNIHIFVCLLMFT